MLSLSNMKGGTTVPNAEDRKKILTQMKVKTTLRGDNSWIQKKSDSEEEKNHSPSQSPVRRRKTGERSPVSPKVSPLNHRAVFEELASQAEQQSPVANKPCKKSHSTTASSGYLIRGVLTKTVDKNAPSNTVSNGSQKSAKSANSAPGYRMSTEDYKRLAPYNVKRDTEPDRVDLPVSPDEQQKRTEAASSVLRQSARKERSYVLSAAKKSNGSAAQEAPSFMAKRIEIDDDTGPRSRSQTMPASSWFSSRGKSFDSGIKNQAPKHSSGYSSAFNHFTSLENSNKQDQEKHNQTSGNDSPRKGSVSSLKRSEKNEGKFQPTSGSEMRDAIFSEDRSSFHYRRGDADTTTEIHHQPETREHLNDNGADSARYVAEREEGTENQSATKDSTDPLPGEGSSGPTPISNYQNIDPKSFEKKTTQEEAPESPSETECKKVEADLAKSDSSSSEGNLSAAGTQTELPGAAKSEKSELEAARSSSISVGSSIATPESHQTEHKSDSDSSRRAIVGSSGSNYRMSTNLDHLVCNRSVLESGHRTSPYVSHQASYTNRTSCGMPSYLSSQQYNVNMSEMNHMMTSHLNNPGFSSGRDSLIANSMRSHRIPFYKDICDAETRRYMPQPEERAAFTSSFVTTPAQPRYPSASGYESDPTTSSKAFLFVKESINSTELSSSPRYNSRSLVDLSTLERSNYGGVSYMQSAPPRRPNEEICTYCGREILNSPKIKIEKLNICCHDFCFRCGICHKPMGDLLDKIYIHRDIVHCDKCYEKLF